jgi:hypothetical protein
LIDQQGQEGKDMFLKHEANWPAPGPERQPPDLLTDNERDLLWCLRRTAMLRPLGSARDAHAHVLLQRRFGDAGSGIEHLLRCLVVGLARRAVRPLTLRAACFPALTDDEWRLVLAVRHAGAPARVAALLAPMTGSRAGELVPIIAGLAALLPR